jgi:hypothetical protein
LFSEKQLLFYIDATNGNIFISGYNNMTREVFDNKGISIEFANYWEVADNSVEFDETLISSIKKALNSDTGEITKENHQVYYQTEIGEAQKIH